MTVLKNTVRIQTLLIDEWCFMEISCYISNKSPALRFVNADTGDVTITPSVCISVPPKKDHIMIKGWGENIGIEKCLEDLGLIGPIAMYHPVNYDLVTEHAMKGKLLDAWKTFKVRLGI